MNKISSPAVQSRLDIWLGLVILLIVIIAIQALWLLDTLGAIEWDLLPEQIYQWSYQELTLGVALAMALMQASVAIKDQANARHWRLLLLIGWGLGRAANLLELPWATALDLALLLLAMAVWLRGAKTRSSAAGYGMATLALCTLVITIASTDTAYRLDSVMPSLLMAALTLATANASTISQPVKLPHALGGALIALTLAALWPGQAELVNALGWPLAIVLCVYLMRGASRAQRVTLAACMAIAMVACWQSLFGLPDDSLLTDLVSRHWMGFVLLVMIFSSPASSRGKTLLLTTLVPALLARVFGGLLLPSSYLVTLVLSHVLVLLVFVGTLYGQWRIGRSG